ncbi:Uncharacterised protein [Burkholderia pseudomallei]|nr:Uncharacterised protein [Burkholderia pseudomallei]
MARHPRDLVRFVHRLEHRERCAAADVGRERDGHVPRVRALEIEQAAAEEQVRRRAVRGDRARFGEAPAVVVVEMDAVAVHGATAQQPVVIVDIEIAAPLGKQLGRPAELVEILRDVALDEHVRMKPGEHAARFELRVRRCRREARRERVRLPAVAVPAGDQLGAVVVARLRGVAQELGAVAVHQHLARDHPQAARLARAEQRVGRLLVHRAVDERRRRAAREQRIEEELGDVARMRGIGEAPLGRERVAVEPRQQARRRRGDHFGLRIVHVRVDEAGRDQLVAHLDERRAGREARGERRMGARRDDAPVLDDQQAVLVVRERIVRLRGVAVEPQQAGAESGLSHRGESVSIEIRVVRRAAATARRPPTSRASRRRGGR